MKREDVSIEHEELAEFEVHEDFSILYSKTKDIWFIEDYSENGKITILEDTPEGIPFEDPTIYKDFEITGETMRTYKDVIKSE